MESPGEYLKREREQRGVSLDDIFNATKVPLKHLRALEADNFDSMPHPTFIKGYIRSYCKVLGLDENDAVLRYEVYLKDKAVASQEPRQQARIPEPRKIQRPPLLGQFWDDKRNVIMVVVGAAVAVIIIVLLIIFGLRGPAPTDEQAARQGVEQAGEAHPVAESAPPVAPATDKPVEAAKPVKAETKAPEPVKGAVKEPAVMRHTLVVKAIETVWIESTIDDGEPFDVTLKKGETLTWKAAETITLKIGNAGGIALTFDGKELAPVGESGYVVRVELPGAKVKVLARPKPETEPAPVLELEDTKESEPAPGVSIRELLPVFEPTGGAGEPAAAPAPEKEIKKPVPAIAPEKEIKAPKPAAASEKEIKKPVPAIAPEKEIKTPAPTATPEKEAGESAPAPPDTTMEGAEGTAPDAGLPPAP